MCITVKKEHLTGKAADKSVSNWLHDNLNVGDTFDISHSYGEFAIDSTSEKPIVMLAAGVGITPMIAALNHLAEVNPQHLVHLLYAVRSHEEYLHRADIEQAIQAMPQLKFKLYTSQVSGEAQDRLTIDDIPPAVLKNAKIYMCGPTSFMQAQKQRLVASGIDTSNIHKEVLGPDLLEELL